MKRSFLPLLLVLLLLAACNLPVRRTATPLPPREATPTRALPTPAATGLPPTLTPTIGNQPGLTITSSRTYDLAFEVTLYNQGSGAASKVELTVALISSVDPFQEVLSMSSTHHYSVETDEYDNQYAVVELNDFPSGGTETVRFEYRVKVNGLSYDLGDCTGDYTGYDTFAEPYIEADAPEIADKAAELSQGALTPCDSARAFYEFIGDNMDYNGYNPGDIGALGALETLAGDCTEFSDLLTALSRAAGIPARPVEGVTCCTTAEEYTAGNVKHNWLLLNLPGSGWVPVDPTWGRFPNQRDDFFAAIDDQHILLTLGRNPAPLNSYHGYTYTWWGSNVDITNEETWSVLEVTP